MRENRNAERDTGSRRRRRSSRAATEQATCDPLAGELAGGDDWERAQAIKRRREYFAAAKAPEKAANIIFTAGLGFDTDATKIVRDFLAGDHLILILASSGGQGKTVAATLGIWVRGHGKFVDAPDLAFTSRFDRDTWRAWAETGLLVIDDLGEEVDDDKGEFQSSFDWLVNKRYNAERKTIITTNLDLETFRARYSERVKGRVRECGRFEELTGPDLRLERKRGTSRGVGKARVGRKPGGASPVQGSAPGAPSRPEDEAGEFGQTQIRLVEREPE
jgi:hypothetical protein